MAIGQWKRVRRSRCSHRVEAAGVDVADGVRDETTHFRHVSGSRVEEEWQNEVVTVSVIEGSPTSALSALEPQRVTEMLMEDNIETLGVQDTQTETGTLVIFTPRVSEHNNKKVTVADGLNIEFKDWDEPTPFEFNHSVEKPEFSF